MPSSTASSLSRNPMLSYIALCSLGRDKNAIRRAWLAESLSGRYSISPISQRWSVMFKQRDRHLDAHDIAYTRRTLSARSSSEPSLPESRPWCGDCTFRSATPRGFLIRRAVSQLSDEQVMSRVRLTNSRRIEGRRRTPG